MNIPLTNEEKDFVAKCIRTASAEGYYKCDGHEGKCDELMRSVLQKLGCSNQFISMCERGM